MRRRVSVKKSLDLHSLPHLMQFLYITCIWSHLNFSPVEPISCENQTRQCVMVSEDWNNDASGNYNVIRHTNLHRQLSRWWNEQFHVIILSRVNEHSPSQFVIYPFVWLWYDAERQIQLVCDNDNNLCNLLSLKGIPSTHITHDSFIRSWCYSNV